MSDAKPVDTPAAEPVAAEAPASETVAETAPAEEAKTEDATDAPAAEPAAEGAEPAAAAEETTALPKEEKTADGEVKITAEPVYSGALGYKAPGLIKYASPRLLSGAIPLTLAPQGSHFLQEVLLVRRGGCRLQGQPARLPPWREGRARPRRRRLGQQDRQGPAFLRQARRPEVCP